METSLDGKGSLACEIFFTSNENENVVARSKLTYYNLLESNEGFLMDGKWTLEAGRDGEKSEGACYSPSIDRSNPSLGTFFSIPLSSSLPSLSMFSLSPSSILTSLGEPAFSLLPHLNAATNRLKKSGPDASKYFAGTILFPKGKKSFLRVRTSFLRCWLAKRELKSSGFDREEGKLTRKKGET